MIKLNFIFLFLALLVCFFVFPEDRQQKKKSKVDSLSENMKNKEFLRKSKEKDTKEVEKIKNRDESLENPKIKKNITLESVKKEDLDVKKESLYPKKQKVESSKISYTMDSFYNHLECIATPSDKDTKEILNAKKVLETRKAQLEDFHELTFLEVLNHIELTEDLKFDLEESPEVEKALGMKWKKNYSYGFLKKSLQIILGFGKLSYSFEKDGSIRIKKATIKSFDRHGNTR